MKWIIVAASILGLSSVIIGAAVDHILENNIGAETLKRFETALRYHQLYSVILLSMGLYGLNQKILYKILIITAVIFLTGIIIFSGSLYLSIFLDLDFLTYGTPIGGLLLMVAWISLGIFSIKTNTVRLS